MSFVNKGELELEYANDANVPVCCFLHEPDEENPKWRWSANNYCPRKDSVYQDSYKIESDTKEEIMEAVIKHVVPLYEAALINLRSKGSNYYWQSTPAKAGNTEVE